MKKLRKALSLLAALAALGGGLLTSCSGDDETVIVKPSYEAEPSIIIVGHKADKIALGGTETLEAKILNSDEESVSWYTDADDEVLTVSDDGLVTANGISDEKVEVWAELSDGTKSNVVSYQVVAVVPKITEVKLLSEPSKLKYATGTPLDLTGLKIGVSYDVSVDDMQEEYPVEVEYSEHTDWFEASGFYSDAAAEKQEVTVTYVPEDSNGDDVEFAENAEKSVKFSVDIIEATVTSVKVADGSKNEYTFGKAIDPLDVRLDIKYDHEELNETVSATAEGVKITVDNNDVEWAEIVTAADFASVDVESVKKALKFTYGGFTTNEAFDVIINSVPVTKITIAAETDGATLVKGKTLKFNAVIEPENATVPAVVWEATGVDGVSINDGALSTDNVTEGGDVTVTASVKNKKSAELIVTVVFEHKIDLSQGSADDWANTYPYSKVKSGKDDTTKVTIDGTETDFDAYLLKNFWLQKGATVNHRYDKEALFFDRSSAVDDQAPVVLAGKVKGKYRIEVDIKATSKTNTSRKIYIKTAASSADSTDGAVASGTEMKTVVDTTQESEIKKTLSYECAGSDITDETYSIVGIDMAAADAVYVMAIRLYTTQATITEPNIDITVKSVIVKDASGNDITNGKLELSKRDFKDSKYNLKVSHVPAAASGVSFSYSLVETEDSNAKNAVSVGNDGTLTLNSGDYDGIYKGALTVTATQGDKSVSVSATVSLEIDVSKVVLKEGDTVTVEADNTKLKPTGSEGDSDNKPTTATLTATLSAGTLDEEVKYQWQESETENENYEDISNETTAEYKFSSSEECTKWFKVVVTGASTNTKIESKPVKITVSNGASVERILPQDFTLASSSSKGVFQAIGETIFSTDRYASAKKPDGNQAYEGLTIPEKVVTNGNAVMGGSDNKFNDAIKFTIDAPAVLTAYIGLTEKNKTIKPSLLNSSGATATATMTVDGAPATLGTATLGGNPASVDTIYKVVITIPSAGDYYFGDLGDKKIAIYYLEVN